MRNRFVALMGLSLMSAPLVVMAEQPYITPVNYPTPLIAGTTLVGTVTNIDPVNRTIQIKDPIGMIDTIRINPNILIQRNGAKVELHNLDLGDNVSVTAN